MSIDLNMREYGEFLTATLLALSGIHLPQNPCPISTLSSSVTANHGLIHFALCF